MSALPLKQRLRGESPLVGLIVKLPDPVTVELAGLLGYHCVVLDTEHGPGGDALVLEHLRAAAASGIDVLVRVRGLDEGEISRALDLGAAGVVIPRVRDAAEAEAAVAAVHYPPRGRRGLSGSTRAACHGLTPAADVVARAQRESVLVVQIEDAAAAEHAAGILSVDGVDAVLPGLVDLAASLGLDPGTAHPELSRAADRIDAAATAAGVTMCRIADGASDPPAAAAPGLTLINWSLLHARTLQAAQARATPEAIEPAPATVASDTPGDLP